MAENNNENVQEVQLSKEELNELIKVRKEKLLAMQEAGNDPFQIVKYPVDTHTDEIRDRYDELEGKEVTIAGRLMSKRIMGKASFCNVQDRNGRLQAYVSRNDIGDEPYAAF